MTTTERGVESRPARPAERAELTAADVMSWPVWTVTPDTSPSTAWAAMVDHRVRHLVVVADGRCVGVLDDREVFAQWPVGPLALRRHRVASMIRPRTACVLPESPVREVARVMNEDLVDAVPVVDDRGHLLGLVTAGDIVAAVARRGVCRVG